MKALLTILFTVSALASACGGTISGRVHAEGRAGADQDANCGKYDSPQLKFAEKVDYDSIRDFIVYIDQPVGTNAPVAPDKPVQVLTTKKQVSQKGAMFNPHVLPIVVGTTVEWPNKVTDTFFYNVYSLTPEAHEFRSGIA